MSTPAVDSGAVIAAFSSDAVASNTQTLTVQAAVPIGDTILIDYGAVATSTQGIFSASDSRGNTYVVLDTQFRALFEEVAIIGATVTTALQVGDTITVVNGPNPASYSRARRCYQIKSYTGLVASGLLDVANDNTSSAGATNSPNVSLIPAAANEFLHAACVYSSALATTTPTWPTGWTADATSNSSNAGSSEKTLTVSDHIGGSGVQSLTISLSSSRSWVIAMVALVPTAGATLTRSASDAPTVSETATRAAAAKVRTASDSVPVADAAGGARSGSTPPGLDGVVVADPVQFGATGALSQVLTVTRAVPIGELVVVAMGCNGGASAVTFTCTDSRGNTYVTKSPAATQQANIAELGILASVLTTALQVGDTITVGTSISRARRMYQVKSFHGVTITDEVTAVQGMANDPSPEVDITTGQGGDFVFAACVDDGIQTVVWASDYQGADTTATTAGSNEKMLTTAFKFPAAAATEVATFITPLTARYAMAVIALKSIGILRVRGATEAVTVSETATRTVALTRTASDNATITPAPTAIPVTAHNLVRTASDSVPVAEAAAPVITETRARTAVDTVPVSEVVARVKIPAPTSLSESVVVSESVSFVFTPSGAAGAGTPAFRWKFIDPNDPEITYFFERNPIKVDSPNTSRRVDAMSTGPYFTPSIRGVSPAHVPVNWSFSGTGASHAMYDALHGWAQVRRVVQIVDDLGRTYNVLPLSFEPVDRPPTPRNPFRYSYTFKCLLFESLPVGATVPITLPTVTQRRVVDSPNPLGVLAFADAIYSPPVPTPAPLPPGASVGNGIAGGTFANPVPMYGATKGQSTYDAMVAALAPDIITVKEGVGIVPLSWVNSAAALVPEGNRVIYEIFPDIAILALGSGLAYAKLTGQLKNLFATMPDVDGHRVIMWPNPYGKHFDAQSWVNASINFWTDVITPINTSYGRANLIRYAIGMQGSLAGTGKLAPYLSTNAKFYCDEVAYEISSVAQFTAATAEAAVTPARPMIIPELKYGNVFHTDGQILAWMKAHVSAMTAPPKNLATNPSVPIDLSNWAKFFGDPNISIAQSTDHAYPGTTSVKSIKAVCVNSNTSMTYGTNVFGLTIGQTYTFSVWVWNDQVSPVPTINIQIPFVVLGSSTTTHAGSWVQISVTWTATATQIFVCINANGSNTPGMKFYTTAFQAEAGPFATAYSDPTSPAVAVCWDNRNSNQIVGVNPLSAAYWATLSTFAGAPVSLKLRRAAAEVVNVTETPTSVAHQVLTRSTSDSVPVSFSVAATSPHKASRSASDVVPVADSAPLVNFVPGILVTKFGAGNSGQNMNFQTISTAYDNSGALSAIRLYRTFPSDVLFQPSQVPSDGRTTIASWQPAFGSIANGTYDLPIQRLIDLGVPIYLAAWDNIDALVAAGTVTAAQVALWRTDMAHLATFCAGSKVKPTIILSGQGYQSYQTYKVPFVNAYAFNFREMLDTPRHNLAYEGTGTMNAALAYMVSTVQQTDGHEILISEIGWKLATWPNATTQRTALFTSFAAKFRQAGVGVACFYDYNDFVSADTTEIRSLVAGGL